MVELSGIELQLRRANRCSEQGFRVDGLRKGKEGFNRVLKQKQARLLKICLLPETVVATLVISGLGYLSASREPKG